MLFEGEYLYGRRKKGKEYYISNKLKFEGEYLNGKKNGNGKEYDQKNGKLIFESEYKNVEKMEKGKNIIMMVK